MSGTISKSPRVKAPGGVEKSEMEKAVDTLRLLISRAQLHTGMRQPFETISSVTISRKTVPPRIEVAHKGQFTDKEVATSVNQYLQRRNWGFNVVVTNPSKAT
jgi:hypothetical protein